MASEEGPNKLDAFFKSKAKKKPKATNLNADRPPPEPKAKPRPAPEGGRSAAEEGWERALRRDQEMLKSCGLWIKEVEADGACLFRAFADQIEGDGGSAHASYRERCVDFLEANRADFEPFLDEEFGGYCRRMREPATWGGHVEAQALARALGLNAVIYQPDQAGCAENLTKSATELITTEAEEVQCLQFSFHPTHHAGQHYNSVRCNTDEGAASAPKMSQGELRRLIEEALKPPVVEVKEAAPAKPQAKGAFAKVF